MGWEPATTRSYKKDDYKIFPELNDIVVLHWRKIYPLLIKQVEYISSSVGWRGHEEKKQNNDLYYTMLINAFSLPALSDEE